MLRIIKQQVPVTRDWVAAQSFHAKADRLWAGLTYFCFNLLKDVTKATRLISRAEKFKLLIFADLPVFKRK